MRYSKGICWVDDTRIPFVDSGDNNGVNKIRNNVKEQTIYGGGKGFPPIIVDYIKQGRFTPSLLVCDDMLNDGSITSQKPRKYKADMDIKETSLLGFGDTKDKIQQGDSGSSSRYYDLDKWFDKVINEIR